MNKLRLLAVLVGVLLTTIACAQTKLAATITDVDIEETGNGVKITLQADGLLEVMAFSPWRTNEDHEFELVLANARSAVGTFVGLSSYPANYLKLEIPSQPRVEELVQQAGGASDDLEEWERSVQEGIGLVLTVRLYRPGHIHTIEVDNVHWDGEWGWDPGEVAYDIRKAQSGRALELTIWSDRREERAPDYEPRAERDLDSDLTVEVEEERASIDAINVPLQKLMSTVGDRLDINVYVDDRVNRLVTMRLEDVSADDLVESVCTALGLTQAFHENSWYISDGLPSSLAPYTESATRTIELAYIEAADAIDLLPNFLVNYLRPSPEGDQIVAQGPEGLLDRVEADIEKFDRPPRTVRLQVAAVETRSARVAGRIWHLLRGGSSVYEIDGAEGSIRFRRRQKDINELVAQIEALDAREKIHVDVRPWVTVESGQGTEIFHGEQQYYRFVEGSDEFGLRVAEAGTTLRVFPQVVGDEFIQSSVAVDVATFRDNRQPPTVDRRSANSTMRMRDGDTMIIGGGLEISQETDEDSGPKLLRPIRPLQDITERAIETEVMREIIFMLSAEIVEKRHVEDSSVKSPRGDA